MAVLNPMCQVDFKPGAPAWTCAVCGVRNMFPKSYANINPSNLPAELAQQFTTIEYTLAVRLEWGRGLDKRHTQVIACGAPAVFLESAGCAQAYFFFS